VSNGNNNHNHYLVLQATEDSPIADAITPETVPFAAKRLAELFRVRSPFNPALQESFDFGGG
jgi:hypothetical protein